MPKKIDNILEHITAYCQEIQATITRYGDNFDIFINDRDYQRSISFSLLQIGELVKNLPMDFRTSENSIPWKQICGLRDIVVHSYGAVDLEEVFKIAHNDIAELKRFCENYVHS